MTFYFLHQFKHVLLNSISTVKFSTLSSAKTTIVHFTKFTPLRRTLKCTLNFRPRLRKSSKG
jgi:hypothetical protein